MGSVEIYPDLTVFEKNIGSRTLGGGAASSLAALNDLNDATYVRAAGTINAPWSALFRFAVPSLPTGAVVESIQSSVRYAKYQQYPGAVQEKIEAVSILIGRLAGGKHSFYGFTAGYSLYSYYVNSSTIRNYTWPHRDKNYDGHYWLWQLLAKPQARIYASIGVARHWPFNLAQCHSFKLIVHYSEPPAVTLQQPSGTETVSRPETQWTYSDNDGHSQAMYELKIFTEAAATASGFNPDTTPYYHKQYAHTSDEFATITKSLPEGNYYAYIRVAERLAAGKRLWSSYASQAFTVDIAAPTAPTVVATYDAAVGGIKVSATTSLNKVTWHTSSLEVLDPPGAIGGYSYTAPTGGGISRSTDFGTDGSWSLKMFTNGTAGIVQAYTPGSGGHYPIVGGQQYTYLGSFYSPVSSRSVYIDLFYVRADGVATGPLVSSPLTATTVGAWVNKSFTHTAPADAASVRIRFRIESMAAVEAHYLDKVSLHPGSSTTWTAGGWLNDDFAFDLEKSLDGGTTWADVSPGLIDFDLNYQRIDFTDYEVPSAATAEYRARVTVINQDGVSLASPYAQDNATMATLTDWWLREVGVADGASKIVKVRSLELDWQVPQTSGFPLDGTAAVVTTSGVKTENLSVAFNVLTEDDYNELLVLLKSTHILLLKDVVGRQWYVKPATIGGEMLRAWPEPGSPYPMRHAHVIPVTFTSVEPPSA